MITVTVNTRHFSQKHMAGVAFWSIEATLSRKSDLCTSSKGLISSGDCLKLVQNGGF